MDGGQLRNTASAASSKRHSPGTKKPVASRDVTRENTTGHCRTGSLALR